MEKLMEKEEIKHISKGTDTEYKRNKYKFEISDREFNVIRAYQTSHAIKKLKQKGEVKLAETLEKQEGWIKYWENDFDLINDYYQHLKDVCRACEKDKKAPSTYHAAFLLGWDSEYCQRAIINKTKILRGE